MFLITPVLLMRLSQRLPQRGAPREGWRLAGEIARPEDRAAYQPPIRNASHRMLLRPRRRRCHRRLRLLTRRRFLVVGESAPTVPQRRTNGEYRRTLPHDQVRGADRRRPVLLPREQILPAGSLRPAPEDQPRTASPSTPGPLRNSLPAPQHESWCCSRHGRPPSPAERPRHGPRRSQQPPQLDYVGVAPTAATKVHTDHHFAERHAAQERADELSPR